MHSALAAAPRAGSADSNRDEDALEDAPDAESSDPARLDPPAVVVLVPLGAFPTELSAAVGDALSEEYGVQVVRHASVPLPKSAYYSPRKRYRADRLLDHLQRYAPAGADETKVLGLTSVDISTTKGKYKDWGIFGLGELGGTTSVISTHRLRRKARDAEHLRFRTTTTAVHEIGHTFGLDHCTEERCVMQDAEGSISNTDGSSGHLGGECRAELIRSFPELRQG
jgi:archaemetzincin